MSDGHRDETGESSDYVEIPARMRGDEVITTRKVPREWWEHTKRVERVKDELRAEYMDRPEVYGMGITKGNRGRTKGGKPVLEVLVELNDMEFASEIPDRVDDVDIEKIEAIPRHAV